MQGAGDTLVNKTPCLPDSRVLGSGGWALVLWIYSQTSAPLWSLQLPPLCALLPHHHCLRLFLAIYIYLWKFPPGISSFYPYLLYKTKSYLKIGLLLCVLCTWNTGGRDDSHLNFTEWLSLLWGRDIKATMKLQTLPKGNGTLTSVSYWRKG